MTTLPPSYLEPVNIAEVREMYRVIHKRASLYWSHYHYRPNWVFVKDWLSDGRLGIIFWLCMWAMHENIANRSEKQFVCLVYVYTMYAKHLTNITSLIVWQESDHITVNTTAMSPQRHTCSMLYSLPATSATLAILSIWFCRPSSRHFSNVRVCLGLIGNPSSSERSSQWRLLIPGLRRPWISGMYGLKSSIWLFTSVATCWTAENIGNDLWK